jgi:hypothetical protein
VKEGRQEGERQARRKGGQENKEDKEKEGRPRKEIPGRTAAHTRLLSKLLRGMFMQRLRLTSHTVLIIDRFYENTTASHSLLALNESP